MAVWSNFTDLIVNLKVYRATTPNAYSRDMHKIKDIGAGKCGIALVNPRVGVAVLRSACIVVTDFFSQAVDEVLEDVDSNIMHLVDRR